MVLALLESRAVLDDIVRGRVDGPLPHALTDEVEVVALGESHDIVHDCAAGRVRQFPAIPTVAVHEESKDSG